MRKGFFTLIMGLVMGALVLIPCFSPTTVGAWNCPYPSWGNSYECYEQDFFCSPWRLFIDTYELTAWTEVCRYGICWCKSWRSLGISHYLYEEKFEGDFIHHYYCYYKKPHDPLNLAFYAIGPVEDWYKKVRDYINAMPPWSSRSLGNNFYVRYCNSEWSIFPEDALYSWKINYAQSFCGSIFKKRYHLRLYNLKYNWVSGLTIVVGYAHHDVTTWGGHEVDCIECAENKLEQDIRDNYGSIVRIYPDLLYLGNRVKDNNGYVTLVVY